MKVGILLACLVLCCQSPTRSGTEEHKQLWAKSFLNRKAPPLVVQQWLPRRPDTRGKFVLVDFWATWCGPCRQAIPELNADAKKFAGKLVVIGLTDQTAAAVKQMTDPPIHYAVAIDTQGRTSKQVEVTGIPHVLLMDPQGIVRWEGFPLLEGHKLTAPIIQRIISRYASQHKANP